MNHICVDICCLPSSHIHFAVFPHIIPGLMLSDVVAVLGSLNIMEDIL